MRKYQNKDEILKSWRRCMEHNLQLKNIGTSLCDEDLKILIQKNEILISTFEEVVNDINIDRCLFLY